MVKLNRPLSANDILANLNGQLSKTNITNCLDDLVKEQKIIEKVYGKQRVFMALQVSYYIFKWFWKKHFKKKKIDEIYFLKNVDCTNLKQELRNLEERIVIAKGELGRVTVENNRLESEAKTHGDKVPLVVLESNFKKVFAEVESLKEQLGKYKSAKIEFISKEEKNKVKIYFIFFFLFC